MFNAAAKPLMFNAAAIKERYEQFPDEGHVPDPSRTTTGHQETGWLIERTRDDGPVEYLHISLDDGSFQFTLDSYSALRLARQVDAQQVFALFRDLPNVRVAEHMWMR